MSDISIPPAMHKNTPRKPRTRILRSKGDYALEGFCVIFVGIFAVCCLIPFLYVFFVSFMSYNEYLANPLRIFPREFVLQAYRQIWGYDLFRSGYRVTLIITVGGTALSVFLLTISAYPLSKPHLKGRKFVMGMILFTMFFNGGMIPNFILIRNLGIHNTLWALILPGCISAFHLILMKNFVRITVSESLEEAAKIDGANDLRILFSVVVPLLKPAIATMIVFNAVHYWNNYFSAMLYVSSRRLWPLMLVLRELVVEDTSMVSPVSQMLTAESRSHPFTLRMAAIVITILPILAIYPFMQRYFVKGISLGSVKE
ncbi:MAG: carbohydrate ABC transporter permease [Defluviitaleaceae bacterium]|nr:carbohydrate ABC transporter permease [Defluviitaleaceae bacterium]MCL2836566.1 carbohydrate ABC transporter permease [Defluviitaleaceae bacterium]